MTVTTNHIWYNDSAGNLFALLSRGHIGQVTKLRTLAYLPFISVLLLKRGQFIYTFTGKSTRWEGAERLFIEVSLFYRSRQ